MRKISTASHPTRVLGAFALSVLFLACGPADRSAPGPESNAGSGGPVGPESAQPPSGGARDFAGLDICSLVPVAEVAKVLGHEPGTGSADATMGRYATDCTYSFGRGDGSSDYAMIWAYPPELWAPEAKGEIEDASGLGDAAFFSKLAVFAQMNVLLEDDLYLDTRAGSREQARALAELALGRLETTEDGFH